MSIFCEVKKEFVVKNLEIAHVVESVELLRAALAMCNDEKVLESYKVCYQNSCELIRSVCGIDSNDIIVFRSDHDGFVLILEMDYADDGIFPYEMVDWPDPEDLVAEGIASLKGLDFEINNLVEALDESLQDELVTESKLNSEKINDKKEKLQLEGE